MKTCYRTSKGTLLLVSRKRFFVCIFFPLSLWIDLNEPNCLGLKFLMLIWNWCLSWWFIWIFFSFFLQASRQFLVFESTILLCGRESVRRSVWLRTSGAGCQDLQPADGGGLDPRNDEKVPTSTPCRGITCCTGKDSDAISVLARFYFEKRQYMCDVFFHGDLAQHDLWQTCPDIAWVADFKRKEFWYRHW